MRPYTYLIMFRLLLTLLALMSGLTCVSGPVQACVYDADFGRARAEIGSVVLASGAARVSAHVVAHAAEIVRPSLPRLTDTAPAPLAPVAMVAAVYTGIDRARE